MTSPIPSTDGWKPDELELRKTEVRIQKRNVTVQAILSVATVAAVFVALWVAFQGQHSLKTATQYNLQQAQDSQFSTALTSLGSSDVTERIAGLVLLELNAADRLTPASSAVFGNQSAYNYYTTTLEIYSGYLHSHGVGLLASSGNGTGTTQFGLGYGTPPPTPFSIDLQYAVDEIVKLLQLQSQVKAVSAEAPAFDLSNDELYELNLTGMNLSWVYAYMVGIDLRGAVLERVDLGSRDDLAFAHLQCADMIGAHLPGANLEDANLSGADLADADFQDADLDGANFQGADVEGANFSGARDSTATLSSLYGKAKGLPPGVVAGTGQPLGLSSCLTDKSLGDPPPPNAAPAPGSSATPSPSATGQH